MRRHRQRIIPLCVLLLALAACGGDDAGDDAATDDDTAAEADATEEEDTTPDDDGDDGESGGDGDDGDNGDDGEAEGDAEGSGSATVTWDGETYEYDGVSCRDSSMIEKFQMRTMRDPEVDDPWLDIRFDVEDGGPDLTGGVTVELFFHHGGPSIGDGEGYRASVDADTIASDASGASGELHLDPDNHSRADELNPDGGTLEFELICP